MAMISETDARQAVRMLRRVLTFLEDGTLVRSIDKDDQPDWALRMVTLVSTLSVMKTLTELYPEP